MATDKIATTLQTIKNDKSLEDHFFKKLATASKPLEWLIPLQDAGYFSPDKNPGVQKVPDKDGYVTIPHWNILDSLLNMAVKNQEDPCPDKTSMLLEIVNGIINYRDASGERLRNFRTDWKLLQIISYLPIPYIGEEHIEFIEDSLCHGMRSSLLDREIGDLFLPKLIKEKAIPLILRLLEVIFSFKKIEKSYVNEYTSVIGDYYLNKTLDGNKSGIAEVCAIDAAKVAIKKMREILKDGDSHFSDMWIPTIENHEQTTLTDKYECQLVYFVRDMLETSEANNIELVISELLREKYEIFKRLALHQLNHHYDALNHLLWGIPFNPLNDITIHEIYELFKAHCKKFDTTQIDAVLNWIENQEYYFSEPVAGNVEEENSIKAYHKKEWLLSLLDSGNSEVKSRYEAYNAVNGTPIEHPGFHCWSYGAHWVAQVSPLEKDEFDKMSNEEFATYIKSYDERRENAPSLDFTRVSLTSAVRTFVLDNPERFASDLTPFLSVSPKYQYELLKAFEEAWRNKKDFDCNSVLSFALTLISNSSFLNVEQPKENSDYQLWTTGAIAYLIEEGTKDDNHAFSADLMPLAERILLILLNNVKSHMDENHDIITSVMNSPKGKLFVAAINYSLRYARLYCREKEDRWVESIKSEFNKRLDKTLEPRLEFSIIAGWFYVNIYYLDKEWATKNVNRIFDLESDSHWEAAFAGYISMTSTIYEDIYILLKDNGHYEKGISYSFKDKHIEEKLVQNIAIGYLAGWDKFEDSSSLLRKLFDFDNPKHLSELVSYVATFGDKNEAQKEKIKPLWKVIVDRVEPNLDKEEYRAIASNLTRWLKIVDTIDDDIYQWLLISARVIDDDWHSGMLVDYLIKHVTKTPKLVAGIYLQMLKHDIYPDYQINKVVEIVQALFELGESDKATRICNLYFAKGFEFLRDTFAKNKQ